MLKLEEQNQSLKKQLVESQLQIKNLTYNVIYFIQYACHSIFELKLNSFKDLLTQ